MSFWLDFQAERMSAADFAQCINDWHCAPVGSAAARVDLHEYLGMTWDQYRIWMAQGNVARVEG